MGIGGNMNPNSSLNASFPPDAWVSELVDQSLREDVGSGDVSTAVAVDPAAGGQGRLVARQPGVVAGLPLVGMVFKRLDPSVEVISRVSDGTAIEAGDEVAQLNGPVGALLTGERTALNFLQHLSGIASLTARYARAVAGTGCRVLDTRKTLPGFRALAKYAVVCGGGQNHRLGLYDRIMLKDNHWTAARGSLPELVARARRDYPALAVEVEVDSLAQLAEMLPLEVEWILLDNFTPELVREAVTQRDAGGVSTRLEASGNITLETIAAFSQAGVDAVSVGRLTHSAPALDIGLDLAAP